MAGNRYLKLIPMSRPQTEREWQDFLRKLAGSVGDFVTEFGEDLIAQNKLPMVTSGNKNSVQIGAGPNLTATDTDPSSSDVSIDAHTVRFSFGDVAYNAGVIAGLNYASTYFIYADDPDYAGGAVTYLASDTIDDLTAVPGRYFVGEIDTPAAQAGGSTTGGGGGGAGGGGSGGGYQWP